jgi:ABC-type multidrug transport system fused ATPase/permease subunit
MEIVEPEANVIEMINISASWTNDSTNKTLTELNIKIKCGKLYAIVGPVGSGKSSIFQLLLGELPIYSGDVLINGDISYASQDPWLFSSTVKNNILFGMSYDKMRYQETVKHCALATDFQQLSHADKTFVGERGSSLSGGQRARISLARAVYRNASIYLLDDPLSAVDAHVGKHLFNECIGPNGYLAKQKATRILITHQVHFLKDADWIIVMDKGKVIRQGTWADVMDMDIEKYIASGDDDDGKNENEKSEMDNIDNKYVASDDDGDDDNEDIPYIDDFVPDSNGTYIKLKSSNDDKKSLSRLSLASSNAIEQDNSERDEEKSETKIDFWNVFYEYFRAGASIPILLFIIIFLLFSQVVTSGSDFFVTFWTNQELLRLNGEDTLFSTTDGLYIYGFLILAVIAVTLSRGFFFFAVCMRASKKIHDKSFLRLLNSPMRFFNLNPCGRILNRFSKDMGAVDELLPKAIIDAAQVINFITIH